MPWADLVSQIVPTKAALYVILAVFAGGATTGAGMVLGFGDYADLPEEMAKLRADAVRRDVQIASLIRGLEEATRQSERILCLVEVIATGETLTPRSCP